MARQELSNVSCLLNIYSNSKVMCGDAPLDQFRLTQCVFRALNERWSLDRRASDRLMLVAITPGRCVGDNTTVWLAAKLGRSLLLRSQSPVFTIAAIAASLVTAASLPQHTAAESHDG